MTTMDDGARRWLLKTAKKNYWRVTSCAYDMDDLIQDGYLVWWRVIARYERQTGRIRSRGHLMKLFQRSYANHIHDLSKMRTRAPVEVKISDLVRAPISHEASLWTTIDTEGYDVNEFERLRIEAPRSLGALVAALIKDGTSRTMRAAFRIRRDGTRETVGERLARMMDAPEKDYDYAHELRLYLHA